MDMLRLIATGLTNKERVNVRFLRLFLTDVSDIKGFMAGGMCSCFISLFHVPPMGSRCMTN